MRKNLSSSTAETVNLVGGASAAAVWTPEQTDDAEWTISSYAQAHEANAADPEYTALYGAPEVFEYRLPGLWVTAFLTGGHVDTVMVVSDDTAARLHRAVRKARPVTITYVKADGEETVRTIEPTGLSLTKGGDVIVKAADRKSGEKRSFRLDRVRTYTVHRTAFLVRMEAPAPSKAELVQAFQARTYTVEYRDLREGERVLYEADSEGEASFVKAVARQDEHLELIHANF